MPIWGALGAITGAARGLAGAGIIRGTVGKWLGGKTGRRAATAAGTAITAVGAGSLIPSRPPPLPGVPRRPQGGVQGTARRILPGGRSGYTFDPYDLNTPTDKLGRPVAVHLEMEERVRCPPGYVSVDLDGDGIKDACVLKPMARSLGLYKSRPKPPLSGADARAIRRAERARKKVKKLAGDVGFKVTRKQTGR